MSVKRYEPNVYEVLGGQYECEMSEDNHGDYVLHSDYAALRARHNALVGAVAWMEECLDAWLCTRMGVSLFAEMEANEFLMLARAEVDRLIADCKGEG